VSIALGDEQGFPHKGTINFVDSRVDAKTATIVVRAVLTNPRAAAGVQLLVPGMSVGIELSVGVRTALLVPQTAVAVELGNPGEGTLLVVTKNVLQRRIVYLGTAQDGYREVRGDLTADDLVVLEPKTLKAGTVVQPKRTKLPEKAPQ
jgi:multidrug efflux pump subunit AcrA (membrane-fusion protein)